MYSDSSGSYTAFDPAAKTWSFTCEENATTGPLMRSTTTDYPLLEGGRIDGTIAFNCSMLRSLPSGLATILLFANRL